VRVVSFKPWQAEHKLVGAGEFCDEGSEMFSVSAIPEVQGDVGDMSDTPRDRLAAVEDCKCPRIEQRLEVVVL
jgi:hypothetical protein